MKRFSNFRSGFTLIELIVVIAVLGVLAAIVLAALNPLEQLNRGKDAGRISNVADLGHAVEAYSTSQGGGYPAAGTSWQTTLVSAGELKQVITINQPSTGGCTSGLQSGFCYDNPSNTDVRIWTILESTNSRTKGACTGTQVPAAVYDSSQGKAGIGCLTNATSVPPAGISLK